MKKFVRDMLRSIYGVFFALSILNVLRLLWSLFTNNDKEWEYFFSSVITLFIGRGATNPKK